MSTANFEELKDQAQKRALEVGIINGEDAIILARNSNGNADWYLYDFHGQVQCIGPEERDDAAISPKIQNKSLDEILRIIDLHKRSR